MPPCWDLILPRGLLDTPIIWYVPALGHRLSMLTKHGRPCAGALQDLDAVLPLAMFLAHERNNEQGPFWQPSIGLLPEPMGQPLTICATRLSTLSKRSSNL